MKKILLLLAIQAASLNNLNAASAFKDVDDDMIDSIFNAVATVKTVAKKADAVGKSAIEKIKIVDQEKYKKVSQEISRLNKQLKAADTDGEQALKHEINDLKILYLSALNPKMLITFLKESGYLETEDDTHATALFTILNKAQSKSDIFAMLDFEQEPTADMIKFQEISKSVATITSTLKAKQAALASAETLLRKYSFINQRIKGFSIKTPSLSQAISELTENATSLRLEISKLEAELEVQETALNSIFTKITDTFISRGYSAELAQKITIQKCEQEITQEDLFEENLLEMFVRKTFDSNNILRKILNYLNFKILLKDLGPTVEKLNSIKLFSIFPWLMLITANDLLQTLDFKSIIALHDIIFSPNGNIEIENIIDSYYKPVHSKDRKQLLDEIAQVIYQDTEDATFLIKINGSLMADYNLKNEELLSILQTNAIKIARMASFMPQIILSTELDPDYKAKFLSLLTKK